MSDIIHRPSSLNMHSACPFSFKLARGRSNRSTDASRGSLLHEIAEKTALGWSVDNKFYVGKDRITEQDVKVAMSAYHSAFEFAVLHLVEGKPSKEDYDAIGQFPEVKLWSNATRIAGTPDIVFIKGRKAVLVDYKFGIQAVNEPEDNLQLKAYALLVHDFYSVDEVVSVVIQPEAQYAVDEPISFSDFDLLRKEIQAVIDKSEASTEADLKVGGVQCQFCPAVPICPAIKAVRNMASDVSCQYVKDALERAEAVKKAKAEAKEKGVAYEDSGELLSGGDLQDLSVDDLANLVFFDSMIGKWSEKAKDELRIRVEAGKGSLAINVGNPRKTIEIHTAKMFALKKMLVDSSELSEEKFVEAIKISFASLRDAWAVAKLESEKDLEAEHKTYTSLKDAKQAFTDWMFEAEIVFEEVGKPIVKVA